MRVTSLKWPFPIIFNQLQQDLSLKLDLSRMNPKLPNKICSVILINPILGKSIKAQTRIF